MLDRYRGSFSMVGRYALAAHRFPVDDEDWERLAPTGHDGRWLAFARGNAF
jgi:hypothetical protein